MLAYSGPFISSYRADLENTWRNKMADLKILFTEGVSMRTFLGNDVKI